MEVDRKGLLEAMAAVYPAVEIKGALLAGTDSFIFDDQFIRAHNDALSVSYPFETGVEAAVRAKELYSLLKKGQGDKVEIEDLGSSVGFRFGPTKVEISKTEDDSAVRELISTLDVGGGDYLPVPGDLVEGIRMCSFSMAHDSSRDFLNGVTVDGDMVLSSDVLRVSIYFMEDEELPKFTIPSDAVEGFLKVLDAPKDFAVHNGWVHFREENGAIFSSRLIAADFPTDEVAGFFPEDVDEEDIKELPKELSQALARVGIMSEMDEAAKIPLVSITSDGENLIVSSERDIGKASEEVKAPGILNKGIAIRGHPDFFREILGMTREFSIKDGKVLFMRPSFNHLISAYVTEESE